MLGCGSIRRLLGATLRPFSLLPTGLMGRRGTTPKRARALGAATAARRLGSSQQRDPRRSRAAKHVTNSSAAFGALVASETSKPMRLAQWRSAATKPRRRKAAI